MALCCAHSAAGYLAYEAVRPATEHRPGLLLAAVLLANAPDLDFVPGLLVGRPGAFHRGVTHTVLAALIVTALVSLGTRLVTRRRGWLRVGAWAGAAYASHLLLDFMTVDAVPPSGAQFLWPMSDRYFLSPVTILPEIIIDPSSPGAFARSLVAPHTVPVWIEEVAVLVLVVAAVHVVRAMRTWVAWRDVPEGS